MQHTVAVKIKEREFAQAIVTEPVVLKRAYIICVGVLAAALRESQRIEVGLAYHKPLFGALIGYVGKVDVAAVGACGWIECEVT